MKDIHSLASMMRYSLVLTLGALLVFAPATQVRAKGFSFIRDAEIENTIRIYSAPLFKAAGLEPEAVHIHLVKDPSLNAFVAGGQRLFLHTGLLMRTENPGQLIGVIAHEAGHIAGGHLTRIHQAMKDATATNILALILGGLVAAGAQRTDMGTAVMMGGQSVGMRTLLRYSQVQESSADQAGFKFLDHTGWSAEGTLEFLRIIESQDVLSMDRQDPYMRTHPLTRDRLMAVEAHIKRSSSTGREFPPEFGELHRRMRAKLFAFIQRPQVTLKRFRADDLSVEARYARAIAYFRLLDMQKAQPLIDGLIAERPNDPYFHELKGQMLFERGHLAEALAPYQEAVNLMPSSALLRGDLAKVQVELNDPALLDSAIANLKVAVQREGDVPLNWRRLAIAYGRNGEQGLSALALAEEALLQGKKDIARYQAGKAENLLPMGSRGWLQAQDILSAAKDRKKAQN